MSSSPRNMNAYATHPFYEFFPFNSLRFCQNRNDFLTYWCQFRHVSGPYTPCWNSLAERAEFASDLYAFGTDPHLDFAVLVRPEQAGPFVFDPPHDIGMRMAV